MPNSSSYFPLRWESTGEQWWYASPIDCAAADGLYDVVRELLHIDANLLIKLTSLRRIRRLETVWDYEDKFNDIAKSRSQVAKKLLVDCETRKGHNTLIRAGYGGWLLYTAASAGDVYFVKEMLSRDPLLVFGEGEYGITDLFYAAARSRNGEVFRMLLDYALLPRCKGPGEDLGRNYEVFKWEIMSRTLHAAARGGNSELLKELIEECEDVLIYKDAQGSTILHSAASRGQVEIVKELIANYDMTNSTDNRGNTALHVAAYKGRLPVLQLLISTTPSLISATNNFGDTFLHMAVSAFRTPGFRRVDPQIELMEKLVSGEIVNIHDIINMRNIDGKTALHLAVVEKIQSDVAELLMTVSSINLNVCDADGQTPLDIVKQRPKSASSKILIKQLVSAGGVSNERSSSFASHSKVQGIVGSPGTSFRIPDSEIFLCTGIENVFIEDDACLSDFESPDKKSDTSGRLKSLLQWRRKKERKPILDSGDDVSLSSLDTSKTLEDNPIPLRQKFSKLLSLPGNKRIFSNFPSPRTKKKFTSGVLTQGVIQTGPPSMEPPSSPRSGSSVCSTSPMNNKQKGVDQHSAGPSRFHQSSLDKKVMNQYLCFGAQGLVVEDSLSITRPTHQRYKYSTSLVA